MIDQVITKYNYKKFGDKYLLTTQAGSYCILTEEEFNQFNNGVITNILEKKLLDAYILIDEHNITSYKNILSDRYNSFYEGPSLHIMVLTLRCNMSCVYCQVGRKYIDKEGYDMELVTARNTVDFIFQTSSKEITIEFQGGEPTLNWKVLKYVIEYAKEKNKEINKILTFSLVTNMTTMNEERMDYLINNDIDICTSLDGDSTVHNSNRKYKINNHEEVIKWIKLFNKEYKKRKINKKVSALVTITKLGLQNVKKLIDEYVKLDLTFINLRGITKLGFAKNNWEKIGYDIEDLLQFWKEGVEYIEELQDKGNELEERMVGLIHSKILDFQDPGFMDLRSPCGAAIGQVAYDTNGDIYTCDEARMMKVDKFKLGNVKINNYNDIIGCEKCFDVVSDSTLENNKDCQSCVYLPYCGNCPVLNYSEYGKTKVDDIMKTERCKTHIFMFDWVVKRFFLK